MRDPVIKQLVARAARCPRLRLSRARRVNCRQAGKLIARLPLGTVYNRARANRTIRLLLGYILTPTAGLHQPIHRLAAGSILVIVEMCYVGLLLPNTK